MPNRDNSPSWRSRNSGEVSERVGWPPGEEVLARRCPGPLPGSPVPGATHAGSRERGSGQPWLSSTRSPPSSPLQKVGAGEELAECRGTPGTRGNPPCIGGSHFQPKTERVQAGERALPWALCCLPILDSPRLWRGWVGISTGSMTHHSPQHTPGDQSLLPPVGVSGVSRLPIGLSCRGGHASPSNSGMGTCLWGLMPKEGPRPQPTPPGCRGLPIREH